MARLKTLKLPKGVEIDEVSNDNLFTHTSAGSVPTTLAVKDYLHDEIDKHDREFMPDGVHRNAIINGNFDIWQRGTSFPNITSTQYTADRWRIYVTAGNVASVSRKQFDVGQTDVPGNPTYYTNIDLSTYVASAVVFEQLIEDVKMFAGQTGTLSFYARSNSGNFTTIAFAYQEFGTGGSTITGVPAGDVYLTPAWQRFVIPISFPSISGKTVGTNNRLLIQPFRLAGVCNIDLAKVQLNIGDKPLPFAPRPIAEELALCQRYYWRLSADEGDIFVGLGFGLSSTTGRILTGFPTTMRVTPTMLVSDASHFQISQTSGGTFVNTPLTGLSGVTINPDNAYYSVAMASGGIIGGMSFLVLRGGAGRYLAFSAEL